MDEREVLRTFRPATRRVQDPVSGTSVWLAGLVRDPRVDDGVVRFELAVTPQYDDKLRKALVEALVGSLRAEGVDLPIEPRVVEGEALQVEEPPVKGMSGPGVQGPAAEAPQPLPGVRHVIAVASGKGGVGKSTVASNLAVALARQGLAVGLLDADIYGPSAPTMLGVKGRPLVDAHSRIVPAMVHGVKVLSMGMVVEAHEPMIWRGPMVMGAIRQFLDEAAWAPLDVLLVDMPPGTGDAQLTLVQSVALSGAVIVTTPQQVALADAIRGIQMFRKLDVPLLGLVENMAYYLLPDGTKDFVFGEDGGVRTAAAYDLDVLGVLPLQSSVREAGDAGVPVVLRGGPEAAPFEALAAKVWSVLRD